GKPNVSRVSSLPSNPSVKHSLPRCRIRFVPLLVSTSTSPFFSFFFSPRAAPDTDIKRRRTTSNDRSGRYTYEGTRRNTALACLNDDTDTATGSPSKPSYH